MQTTNHSPFSLTASLLHILNAPALRGLDPRTHILLEFDERGWLQLPRYAREWIADCDVRRAAWDVAGVRRFVVRTCDVPAVEELLALCEQVANERNAG